MTSKDEMPDELFAAMRDGKPTWWRGGVASEDAPMYRRVEISPPVPDDVAEKDSASSFFEHILYFYEGKYRYSDEASVAARKDIATIRALLKNTKIPDDVVEAEEAMIRIGRNCPSYGAFECGYQSETDFKTVRAFIRAASTPSTKGLCHEIERPSVICNCNKGKPDLKNVTREEWEAEWRRRDGCY